MKKIRQLLNRCGDRNRESSRVPLNHMLPNYAVVAALVTLPVSVRRLAGGELAGSRNAMR